MGGSVRIATQSLIEPKMLSAGEDSYFCAPQSVTMDGGAFVQ